MIVNIHAAKTNLSKLIAAAEAGEEVIVARNGKPAVKLTPVEPPAAPLTTGDLKKPAWFGMLKGKIWMSPDFDADNEDIGRLMEEGDVFPRDEDE